MDLITTTLKIFEVLNFNPVSVLLFPCNCMLHFMVKAQKPKAGHIQLYRSQNNHLSHHANNSETLNTINNSMEVPNQNSPFQKIPSLHYAGS